ncbi:hypothetical protein [Lysobacter enzymogenes]|nr:hypothetical protein [Lysobacter enzymogenes]
MFKITPLVAGALALAVCDFCQAAAKDIDGYRPERAELAAQMPVYIVALNERVRPQVAYPERSPGMDAYLMIQTQNMIDSLQPAMSSGSAIATGALGGAIGVALGEAMVRAAAREYAAATYAPLLRSQCDLQVDAPLQGAVREATARSPWGAAAQPVFIAGGVEDWDKQIAKDRPRQVISVTASMTPDFSALVTTVDAAAFAPEDASAGTGWQKKPLWRDQLIVVSDPMALAPKTQADIDRMVAEENARYAESGDLAIVERVAKDRYGSGKPERSQAVAADRRHQSRLKLARAATWVAGTDGARRAQLWSEDSCAPMRAALDQAVAETGRLLDDLYAQRLPARVPSKDTAQAWGQQPGARAIQALPGGVYVSRNDAGATQLDYRFSLLPLKD